MGTPEKKAHFQNQMRSSLACAQSIYLSGNSISESVKQETTDKLKSARPTINLSL